MGAPRRSLRRVPGVQSQEGLGDRFLVVYYNLRNALQAFTRRTHGHRGAPSQVPPPRSMASANDGERVAVANVVHRRRVQPPALSSRDSDQHDAVAHKAVQRRTEQELHGPVGERGCYVEYLRRGLPSFPPCGLRGPGGTLPGCRRHPRVHHERANSLPACGRRQHRRWRAAWWGIRGLPGAPAVNLRPLSAACEPPRRYPADGKTAASLKRRPKALGQPRHPAQTCLSTPTLPRRLGAPRPYRTPQTRESARLRPSL